MDPRNNPYLNSFHQDEILEELTRQLQFPSQAARGLPPLPGLSAGAAAANYRAQHPHAHPHAHVAARTHAHALAAPNLHAYDRSYFEPPAASPVTIYEQNLHHRRQQQLLLQQSHDYRRSGIGIGNSRRGRPIQQQQQQRQQLYSHSKLQPSAADGTTAATAIPLEVVRRPQQPPKPATIPPKPNPVTKPTTTTTTKPKKKTPSSQNPSSESKTESVSSSFPYSLFVALNEEKYADALRWSDDGKRFVVDQKHPKISDVLFHYFKHRSFNTFSRQLARHGWNKIPRGKNKGHMFHKLFRKTMGAQNFLIISRLASEGGGKSKSKSKSAIAKKKGTETDEKSKKAVSKIVSKKTKEKSSAAAAAAKKTKGVSRKTTVTATKTTATTTTSEADSKKKRKKPPTDATAAKKKPTLTPKGDRATLKKLKEHQKLHNLFWKWDLWNFPQGLDIFLENGKVQTYPTKKKKTTKADAADAEPELQHDGDDTTTKDETIASLLLCDEELPDSILGTKEEQEQALAELVDRIRQDRLQQDKLKELWSKSVIPVVKGKVLPPAKFAKPTDKWKEVKVGDRIAVYWRDDELFYNANVQKQQENTSYFYLLYDDDGAQEWLDLSREDFKILENAKKKKKKKPVTTALHNSTPLRASKNASTRTRMTDETPRKDNRGRMVEETNEEDSSNPCNLPDSHSHLSSFVRYSWKGLGLGSDVGTPLYNSFVKERDPLASKVTALDILNEMRALRSRGFSGISLKLDTHNSDSRTGNSMVTNRLRGLEDKISRDNNASSSIKHFNQTLKAVRKLTDTWSIPMVRENLRTIESQVLKLNEQEARILQKCKQKGLC